MTIAAFKQTVQRNLGRRPLVFTLCSLAVLVLIVIALASPGSAARPSNIFQVSRGDFLISIVEGGTVEAVNEVVIRNEVEGTARIIFIVPEGTYVKKGDLLVGLDSSSSQDAVSQQQINVEKAQFALVQAEQQFAIQKSVVDSEIDAAQLKVEFAELDHNKYVKGEAVQLERNAQIEITNVIENLRIAEERLQWTEELFKQGYETKANLDKDRLSVSQTKLKLEQAEKSLWMLSTFDAPKKRRELEASLAEAREDLDRVKLQGERKLAQFEADVLSQKKTLELSQAKLDRDRKQLAATQITAPQDGLVVYSSGGGRFSSESLIEEGAVVRNRQELIKLPDVSEMKLLVKIHESHINQIRTGLPAFVVLDSMPDQRYRGHVTKVAPLPDSQSRWGNPNLKLYATEIRISDKLPDVKPGVSARAEIVITNLSKVLRVPIQVVTTLKGQQVAYLASSPPKAVPVKVGLYNNKFIEITSGLNEGDRILLSPPFDTQEKDLGGAILGQEDAASPAVTNQLTAIVPPPSVSVLPSPADNSFPREGGERRGPRRDESGRPGGDGAEGGPPARRPGGDMPNREEFLKQFDKNGDGELDESERAAMRERFGSRRRGTNAPPVPPRDS